MSATLPGLNSPPVLATATRQAPGSRPHGSRVPNHCGATTAHPTQPAYKRAARLNGSTLTGGSASRTHMACPVPSAIPPTQPRAARRHPAPPAMRSNPGSTHPAAQGTRPPPTRIPPPHSPQPAAPPKRNKTNQHRETTTNSRGASQRTKNVPGALGHADDDGGSPPRPGWDDMSPAASHNQPPPR